MSLFSSLLIRGQTSEGEGMIQGKQRGKGAEIMAFNQRLNTIQTLQKPGSLHRDVVHSDFRKGRDY